jgi:cytochrome c oxidase subunit 2
MSVYPFTYFPALASEHGATIDRLMVIMFSFMTLLILGWFIFFVYTLIRFRSGKSPKADAKGMGGRWVYGLACAILVVEMIIHFGLGGGLSASALNSVLPTDETVQVRVVAQQFAWNIHYPGADGVFGKTAPEFYNDQSNPVGIDPDDEFGKDDIVTFKQLYLPVNKPVRVELTTKDVIHSFFLPEFRVKQDVMPGMEIPVTFVPTMTTAEFQELKGDETRNFEIACAQLCGITHYTMKGFVTVLDEDGYNAWLEENAPSEDEGGDDFWDDDEF